MPIIVLDKVQDIEKVCLRKGIALTLLEQVENKAATRVIWTPRVIGVQRRKSQCDKAAGKRGTLPASSF